MGKAKMSLAALFYVMASNMTEVARWRLRIAGVYSLDVARQIKTRTPRRHTRNRLHAARNKDQSNRSRAAIQLLEELGIVVDADTGEIINLQLPPPSL
jgi:hypothetical protein